MSTSSGSQLKVLRRDLAPDAQPHLGRAVADIATSVVPYAALSVLMYLALDVSYLLVLALADARRGLPGPHVHRLPRLRPRLVPALQARQRLARHRCSGCSSSSPFRQLAPQPRRPPRHGRRPRPARRRRRAHDDRRRVPRRRRGSAGSATALFRNPLVMFGHRPDLRDAHAAPPGLPVGARPRIRRSVHRHEHRARRAGGRGCAWLVGLARVPARAGADRCCSPARPGVWLFYVQHQFEDTYWQSAGELELRRRGAARQQLPEAAEGAPVLHRQHRAAPRAPPERARSPTTTCSARTTRTRSSTASRRSRSGTALRAVRLKLWDEERGRLVTFAERAPSEPCAFEAAWLTAWTSSSPIR